MVPLDGLRLRIQASRPNANPMSIIVQLAGTGVALTPGGSPPAVPCRSAPKPNEPFDPAFASMLDKLEPLLPPAEPSPC